LLLALAKSPFGLLTLRFSLLHQREVSENDEKITPAEFRIGARVFSMATL
jgi:hypothetical protein